MSGRWKEKRMKYSVVVPCYNEAGNIEKLVDEFEKVNCELKKDGFELILVNNGSSDGTEKEIVQCMEKYDFIRLAQVKQNKGYGYGILQGMTASNGEYIGWIHADLQFSPLLFVDMAKSIENETEELGKLYYKGLRKNRPLIDTFFTIGMSCFETIYLKTALWDINGQPTLISRELFEKATNPPYGFALDLYYYYCAKKMKYKVRRFASVQKDRMIGTSSWNTGLDARVKLIKRTIQDSKAMRKENIG